jgi:adenine-specific DNA-methyltransferase
MTNFLTATPASPNYRTIIGNPPYVKQRGKPNLYIQFIERCYALLDKTAPGAEMLFIVPSDFIKLTSAAALLTRMISTGAFTEFLFPHDEGLFSCAAVDVMVFRYEYGANQATTNATVNGVPKQVLCSGGILTFKDITTVTASIGAAPTVLSTFFDVYVGIVSGRDEIYRKPFGNVSVLTDIGRTERFILPHSFPTGDSAIDTHLLQNKAALLERRIRTFTERNWFEWGALRNITAITAQLGTPCIYVRNMTRNPVVAATGTVQFFGGSLLCLIPKEGVLDAHPTLLEHTVSVLHDTRAEYMYAGRYKIGHRQVSQMYLPLP